MSSADSKDELNSSQSTADAVNAVSKEKKNKNISFKTIFMIVMIIAILLFMLARALFSLKDSFGSKNNQKDDVEEVVVDNNIDFKSIKSSLPASLPSKQVKDDNLNDDDDDDLSEPVHASQQKKVVKGKLGLAQVKDETTNTTNTTNKTSNVNSMNNTDSEASNSKAVVKAEILKLDPNLSIRRGTFIKCSLRTALISQISGDVGCIVNDDVYSSNGHVLLIEKGSIVNGAFRRAGVNHGDSRIFVLWEEIITPNDVTINVNSGASDVLGAQGIDGWVDNHFWTRFGNAILVSLITDASSSVATRLQKDNTYNGDFSTTTEGGANVARTIIEKSVDIPPTIYRNHGDSVGIYISQNIDFSDVYKLEYKK